MFTQFALLDFSTTELILILAIVVVLFGGRKLPELSKSIGQSIREIRGSLADAGELKNDVKTQAVKARDSLTRDS